MLRRAFVLGLCLLLSCGQGFITVPAVAAAPPGGADRSGETFVLPLPKVTAPGEAMRALAAPLTPNARAFPSNGT